MTIDTDTRTVDAITAGFITAALWADCEWTEADADPSGESGGREHLTPRPALVTAAREVCESFYASNREDCDAWMADYPDPDGGHAGEYVGHNLYLTAARHGAGFWDRGAGELGDRLTANAHPYGDFRTFDCGDGTADVG